MTQPAVWKALLGCWIAWSLSAATTGAAAQSAPSVDAAGACPSQEVLERLNPALGAGSIAGLVNRLGTPARPGIAVYRSESRSGATVQGLTLGYDDDVEVLLGVPVGERGSAFVRRVQEPRSCGWIDAADLERNTLPKKLTDVPGFEREIDRLGARSTLDARVVVKNRANGQTGHIQRAPLFNEPFAGDVEPPESARRGSIGYFEVLSVFDIRRADGGRCRTFRDKDCFLRVGSTNLTGTQAGRVRTRGWLRGPDVEIWPSALAVYYGVGKQGLKIHQTDPSARIGTPFASFGSREQIIAYQPDGRYEEPPQRNIMRFPVIRGTALSGPGQGGNGRAPGQDGASYTYEIVFNGQACLIRADGTDDCVPEDKVKRDIADLGIITAAIDTIDVLFVVDATESMGPYLRSVVQALRQHISGKVSSGLAGSFRYSVAVYGDYNRKRDGGLDFYSTPFSSDIGALRPIENANTYDDENKDKFEAPFAALERAALNAQWRPNAANRLLIWIGDHGNRAAGRHRTVAGELEETRTADTVVAAIKAADEKLRRLPNAPGALTNTRFVALQVQGGAATGHPDFQKFREDAEKIKAGLHETAFNSIPATVGQGAGQDAAALVGTIAKQLDQTIAAAITSRDLVLRSLGGDTAGMQGNLAPASLLAREFLEQLGFSPQRLLEMGRRIQIVRPGFVFQSGQSPDLRYWLGLRLPEFYNVRQTTQQLCNNLSSSDHFQAVEDSMLSLVRAVTFTEMRQGETVRDFYSRVLSVPGGALSPILGQKSPADFVLAYRGMNPQQRSDFMGRVCKKARILEYIGNGQIVDEADLVYERSTIALKTGKQPKDFDWRWISSDAQTIWFFIPLDVLP